ncbi:MULTISPECIES: ScbR family autoregulator-binding transcription factor [unclassified Streptomyces]|uniref:TetR/AcrR family transcriptional regulator n=1 Tax=Streptomyces sp. NBC_00060 TaxID=2975636 RepID=A0AAU2H6B0_9ACTN
MAKQDRAIRTRRAILEAAAIVFEKQGFQAATITDILKMAGVTKGALYFHFQSKEALAHGVLNEQGSGPSLPPQPVKLQELIDSGSVLAHRLRTDHLVRASIRLTLDQQATGLDRSGPFRHWSEVNVEVLTLAQQRGELMPNVVISDTAELYVGAFAGLQMMSQTLSDYQDLSHRHSVLQRHVMSSIAVPSVLAALDFSEDRGARLTAEMETTPVAECAAAAV